MQQTAEIRAPKSHMNAWTTAKCWLSGHHVMTQRLQTYN